MANLDVYEYCKRFVVDHNFFGRSTILRDMISNIVLISTQALKPEAPTFEVLVVNKKKFKGAETFDEDRWCFAIRLLVQLAAAYANRLDLFLTLVRPTS